MRGWCAGRARRYASVGRWASAKAARSTRQARFSLTGRPPAMSCAKGFPEGSLRSASPRPAEHPRYFAVSLPDGFVAAKAIVRLVEGVHLIRRGEMAEVRLTGQHHARAVGLFETSLNHRTRCCKSSGIRGPD